MFERIHRFFHPLPPEPEKVSFNRRLFDNIRKIAVVRRCSISTALDNALDSYCRANSDAIAEYDQQYAENLTGEISMMRAALAALEDRY